MPILLIMELFIIELISLGYKKGNFWVILCNQLLKTLCGIILAKNPYQYNKLINYLHIIVYISVIIDIMTLTGHIYYQTNKCVYLCLWSSYICFIIIGKINKSTYIPGPNN